jgi:hypothetical protein
LKKHNATPHDLVVPDREDLVAELIDDHGYDNGELARFVCTYYKALPFFSFEETS